jgi:hypothetical protein
VHRGLLARFLQLFASQKHLNLNARIRSVIASHQGGSFRAKHQPTLT